MRILVLSDSHSGMRFMRECITRIKPDRVIHLGDYYDDAETLAEEYPDLIFYQMPGNCDRYRCPPWVQEIQIMPIDGVRFYMTHGHRHNVKMTTLMLRQDACRAEANIVLYGHTHIPDCCLEDGLWIMNPGSCGSMGGTAGIIEIEDGEIIECRILCLEDLEEFV